MHNAVFFTGHRPDKLGGYDAFDKHTAIRDSLQRIVESWYEQGKCDVWISGMALGADTLGAQAVIAAKAKYPDIHLVAAVPFPSQWRAWTRHWDRVRTYREILGHCSGIFTVSQDPYTRDKMMLRNRFMVEFPNLAFFHSNIRIEAFMPCETVAGVAVYNGAGGGTGNCVGHAKKVGKPVLGLHPDTLEMNWL